jgi:hypothetical protein
MPHVKVKELPEVLRSALVSVGYHGADVAIKASERYSMSTGGSGNGRRAFVCAVNLATGERIMRQGSWGGPNPFNPTNAVDLDDTVRDLPPNFAVIHGSEGEQVYASVDVNPATLAPLLPEAPTLTESERAILCAYAGLTSAGRKRQIEDWCSNAARAGDPDYVNAWARRQAEATCKQAIETLIAGLVSRGFLARNKAGAVSVTTAGKNAGAERSQNRALWSRDWHPTV